MVTETWFHNFGKWTLTAASRDAAASNARAAWFGLNQIVLERNASVPDDHYELVGPTGCAKVARAWTAERYLVGDNQIHWVWNGAPNATGEDEISVAEQHEFVRALHGDLSEFDQFMDTMYTSYVPRIDPYVELARQLKVRHGWEYKFVQGRSADEDVPVWSVLVANADGQIFELVSARLENVTNAAAFVADDCWFRPLGSFPDAPYFTDFEAEAVDLSKLGSFIKRAAAAPRADAVLGAVAHVDRVDRPRRRRRVPPQVPRRRQRRDAHEHDAARRRAARRGDRRDAPRGRARRDGRPVRAVQVAMAHVQRRRL